LSLSAIYSGIGTANADSVIATIGVGSTPVGVAFDSINGNLYVTNFSDNTVSVISGKTHTVIGSPIPVGSNPLPASVCNDCNFVEILSREFPNSSASCSAISTVSWLLNYYSSSFVVGLVAFSKFWITESKVVERSPLLESSECVSLLNEIVTRLLSLCNMLSLLISF
jgi:YVTN family beta-propeller protein